MQILTVDYFFIWFFFFILTKHIMNNKDWFDLIWYFPIKPIPGKIYDKMAAVYLPTVQQKVLGFPSLYLACLPFC